VLVGRVRTATALAAARIWFEPEFQILIRITFVMGEASLSLGLRRWGGMVVWPPQQKGFGLGVAILVRAGRYERGTGFWQLHASLNMQ
jgi:hypothetical protein